MFCSFHPLADKTNNKHLRKPFFKVIRKSLYYSRFKCAPSYQGPAHYHKHLHHFYMGVAPAWGKRHLHISHNAPFFFFINCIAYRDPRRELFNTLKRETNLFLDSMTPSSAFASLISMKQGEKTQKIVAKYVYDRFRERDSRVKYNLV